jgi:hypothetical protein
MDTILFDIPLSRAPPDLEALKRTRVPGQEKHGLVGRKPALDEHLACVRTSFAGEPQIDFYHAALSVLIRRGMDTPLAIERFEQLWSEQGDHLLASLDSRWLVSACDTLMDWARNPLERAIACIGSTFMNTIKLYETERLGSGTIRTPLQEFAHPAPLFDGMTSFSVGRGDMIHNLRKRTAAVCAGDTTAGKIVLELLKRADRADTVYRRLAELHQVEETRW